MLKQNSKEIDITQSQASHRIKFGYICANKGNIPRWVGVFCFVISFFQNFAVIMKVAYLYLNNDAARTSPIITVLLRFLTMTDWLSTSTSSTFIIFGASIVLLYILHMNVILFNVRMKIHQQDNS